MLKRPQASAAIQTALKRSQIAILLGPRQCGKTTLARQFALPTAANYFDLENPTSLARLQEPMTALEPLRGLIIIDEIQQCPDLFPVLRVLADRKPLPARFLILGSASPTLLRQSSESLAGRTEIIELSGFNCTELSLNQRDRLWLRGGFPRSFLARSDEQSFTWREQLIRSLVERDIPSFGGRLPAVALLRFCMMLAHYHGQIWNAAEPARSLGISEPTVRHYLDLLSGLFLLRQLPPWYENLSKRQVKSPKIYFRDCGLLHQLLGIRSQHELLSHPKCGASWEGLVLNHILTLSKPDQAYFWATHQGAELDLLLFKRGKRYGVEIKHQDAPQMTPSIRTALADLQLEHLVVIYPGELAYPLRDRVSVIPFSTFIVQGEKAITKLFRNR